jgi:hypothetical protein
MANLKKELDKCELVNRSGMHISINTTFVFISVSVLTFILSLNSQILRDNFLLSIQLALSIPLFIYANIARSRLIITPSKIVDSFGSLTYTLGFVFFMNSTGILISVLISQIQGIIFFLTLIILMIIYGKIVGKEHFEEIGKIKINRELILLSLTILLGLLPILGVY